MHGELGLSEDSGAKVAMRKILPCFELSNVHWISASSSTTTLLGEIYARRGLSLKGGTMKRRCNESKRRLEMSFTDQSNGPPERSTGGTDFRFLP